MIGIHLCSYLAGWEYEESGVKVSEGELTGE